MIPILGDLINGVKDLVSEVVVDKDKRDQVNLELAKLADQAQSRLDSQMAAQTDINKIEASNPSLFVAGWRPFIGWVGGIGLAYSSIIEPFLEFVAKTVFKYSGGFPTLNTEILLQVLMAILGLGVMRSYEKTKGVETTATRSNSPSPVADKASPDNPEVGAVKKKHFHIF